MHFSFTVKNIEGDTIYFYRTSALNAIRAQLAEKLQQYLEDLRKKETTVTNTNTEKTTNYSHLKDLAKKAFKEGGSSYLRNCSNKLSKQVYTELGMPEIQPSYEQLPPKDAILMRCKYCIRYQIGMCKKDNRKDGERQSKATRQLYLKNGNNTLTLEFDCSKCEMLVKFAD